MIRKLIFRTFLVGATLLGIGVVAVAVCGFLAFRPPQFYVELRGATADEALIAEAEQHDTSDPPEDRMKYPELARGSDHSTAR